MTVGRQKSLQKNSCVRFPRRKSQISEEHCSIRGALSTAFMKPENVIGALVYSDGNGNWWGDVVFNKGEKYFQIGLGGRFSGAII